MSAFDRRMIRAMNPWCYRPLAHREIAGVMIHATRGGRTAGDDGVGTENWAASSSNGSASQGWGSSWDALVYESGLQVQSFDLDHHYASWGAGFGDAGTWGAGMYYLCLELAQGRIEDPFPDVQLHSAAQWVGEWSKEYSFPLVKIPYLTQVGPRPRGICSHEDSANGRKLGKTDPGPMFPWDRFLELATSYATGEAGHLDITREEIRQIAREEAKRAILEGDDEVDERLRSVETSRHRLEQLADGIDATKVEKAVALAEQAGLIAPLPTPED